MLAALIILIVISVATWWAQHCYDRVNTPKAAPERRDGAE